MDMNFDQKELEILSDALDELNYRLDMTVSDDWGDSYERKLAGIKLQAACDVHDRILAALALEAEINELGYIPTP